MQEKVDPLPYEYDSLEPYIDKETMTIHHDKHHQAYLDKYNAAVKGTELEDKDVNEVLKNLSSVPSEIKTAVINNGGGFVNHTLFWQIMKKDVKFEGEVAEAIKEKFGSYEKFKEEFSHAAATQFGSGWAWLIINKGELEIVKTPNQDTLISEGKIPILCIDVWEHSYYLKYQNKRPDYIEAFFKVINWEKVNKLYLETKK
jgi:Fe-Mn family superoxide dismutase